MGRRVCSPHPLIRLTALVSLRISTWSLLVNQADVGLALYRHKLQIGFHQKERFPC